MAAMKVLVAEGNWLVRAGLKSVLRGIGEPMQLSEADSLDAAAAAAEPEMALVLLDYELFGPEGVATLRRSLPKTSIVVFSGTDDRRDALDAIDRGAAGFISKSATGEEILHGLRHVLAGAVYLPRHLIERTASSEQSTAERANSKRSSGDIATMLTERQFQVFEILGKGKSNDEIAAELGLSKHTIRMHVATICAKLGAKNRVEVALMAGSYPGTSRGG